MLYLLLVYRVFNLNVVDTNTGDNIRNADCTLVPKHTLLSKTYISYLGLGTELHQNSVGFIWMEIRLVFS